MCLPKGLGSKDYDFYNSSSPEKKFYLKYYAQADKYFFVDENGQSGYYQLNT
jgi:hypothetical protein